MAVTDPRPSALKTPARSALLLALVLAAPWGAPARAQTEWSTDLLGPTFGEYNAPPPCILPVPPPYMLFPPPPPPAGCPFLVPAFAPCQMGGTAVDNDGNFLSGGPAFPAVLGTDGFTIEMTTPGGAYIATWPGPPVIGPLSGLGYDSAADILWCTDGVLAVGLGLGPACALLPVVVPPFPVLGLGGGPESGIAWDPCTGTLWTCDCTGMVTNHAVGGGILGGFPAAGLVAPLTGAGFNSVTGNVQVTDGALMAEYTPLGALAPPVPFYLSANPYPLPAAPPVDGLGFSLRPLNYCVGFSPFGPPPTAVSAGGYPFAGNAGFSIGEVGATPGGLVFLAIGVAYLCPALPIPTIPPPSGLCVMPLMPPPFVGVVGAAGTFTMPFPIPPPAAGACAPLVGLTLEVQFINSIPPVLEVTDALTFSIGAA